MSSFSVVVCGVEVAPLRAHPAALSVRSLPAATRAEFLSAGQLCLDSLDPDLPVVVLHRDHPDHSPRIGILRALNRPRTVIGVPVPTPPTGLAARAIWLASLAQRRVPPLLAVAHLGRHPDWFPTTAVLSSTAGLTMPGVRLGQHVASFVPGVRFGVSIAWRSEIRTNAAPPVHPPGTALDRVVRGRPDYDRRLDFGLPATVETAQIADVDPASDWWGRARFFEQTLIPRDVRGGIQQLALDRYERCSTCGGVVSEVCPLCETAQGVAA